MLPWLEPDSLSFPPLEQALAEPEGLLAVGGDLTPARILAAYQHGCFPWFQDDQEILWWSPNPRTVLIPSQLHVSRSLRKTLRQGRYRVSYDQAFARVISECAGPRHYTDQTWITDDMRAAYCALHELGHAHSVEVWLDDQLVGGLYGLAIGCMFFGESMFSRQSDASKVGFVTLVESLTSWGFELIDCQMHSDHLASLGASTLPRTHFAEQLAQLCPRSNNATWLA
ncbi:leucyl/phenylalanyl-tRNA--protein transferase [Atopomonas sediminilitoris]|uniref:leucyl/phenylalanyl-tRNA--protein transferase n=1 Tax=Atopomonas sediminilitoris TaxID=2919919 RepID=UPI001F4E5948|nr:leucyl/phenylalanyl-tRNA--protein transferase [Atopomonas sediminilitoris]